MGEQLLVVRPGALGDTIVTSDALSALRQQFPQAAIELVGNAPAGRLLEAAGLVDRVTSFDGLEVAALCRPEPSLPARWTRLSSAVVWLPPGSAVERALRAAGPPRVIGASPHPTAADGHVADHLVRTLEPLGVAPVHGTTLVTPLPERQAAPDPRLAIVHPGSGAARKNWAAVDFAQIVIWLLREGWRVRLLAGPADEAAVRAVSHALGAAACPILHPDDLITLGSVLAEAGLLVGNDSGVTHLAARLGVPTVAIFGASDPAIWAPRGPRVVVVGTPGAWPTADDVRQAIGRLLRVPRPGIAKLPGASLPALQQERRGENGEQDQDGDAVDH